ncbi:hypothetical protein M1D89_00080 (plasmid) [Arthrobacter sp. D3-18]
MTLLIGSAAACLTLAACTSPSTAPGSPTPVAALPVATGDLALTEVCESELTVQLQWQPQSDMGAMFELLGDDYSTDPSRKSVTGSLVASGADTGIDLTLLAGGPAIGFQPVTSQMYADDDIDLGLVHSDQLIAAAKVQPVVGLTPLLTYSPAMLMWDPKTHGDDFSITDIATTDAPVVVSRDQIFPAWMVAKGYLAKDQIDSSYDGNPARFVSDPAIIQQGFANSEPYTYEHDTPAWDRRVGYQLLRDVGYEVYASNVTVRSDRLEEMTPCLERLVPIIQQASADYITDPAATNQRIVDIVATDETYSPYTIGKATYSAKLLAGEGLITNENGTIGGYDMDRVQRFVDELTPIIAGQGTELPANLHGTDLFTTAFVDRAIAAP